MQKHAPSAPAPMRPLWVVVLSAGLIVGIAMGLRQVMGLYLQPMTTELGIGREPFSTSMAVANLIWGIGAVAAGMVADRYGAGRVVVGGTLATMAGLYVMYSATSAFDLMVSGVLLGIGVSGTGITALVGAAGRAAPPDKRTAAIASLGMASGIGSFIAFPYTHVLMSTVGWQASLLVLIATMALVLPLAWPLSGKPAIVEPHRSADAGRGDQGGVHAPQLSAARHRLLRVRLPRRVLWRAPAGLRGRQGPRRQRGRGGLTTVGLANLVGTYIAGQSGRFIEKRRGLSLIYFGRCFVFLGLLFLPITPFTIIAMSAVLGLLWLSTVPLTSSLVATFFGTRWMSMLFGVVFLSHQVGSFTGLWLAGTLYDLTKSYDMMWWISIALGLFAAAVHWPIQERPVSRLAAANAA